MASNELKVNSIEFDEIKQNVKDFLKTRDEFLDVDFEASAISTLLDALAYTAHYMAVYNNLTFSEVFLQSSQMRENVVAKAKELNYFPRQTQSSVSVLDISYTDGIDHGVSIIIPKGTRFSSSIDGISYEFVSTDDQYLLKEVGTTNYTNNEVYVYQGSYITEKFTVDANTTKIYRLSNEKVDTRFLTITIAAQENSSDIELWSLSDDITLSDEESKIYFLQESKNRVEFYFADGVIGREPVNNNLISVVYLLSKGSEANGCNVFDLVNDIGTYSRTSFVVNTVERSKEGAEKESIESIKLLAPKSFQAQNRAVTLNDYEVLVRNAIGSVDSVNIWDGSDNIPPAFGKVYISVKPVGYEAISPATKVRLLDEILSNKQVVGIRPEIVDADYTYIDVFSNITVDMRFSHVDRGELITNITNTINNYFTNDLNSFKTSYRGSRIGTLIDNVDDAIISNETSTKVKKKIIPLFGTTKTYLFNFNGGILPNSLSTTLFGFEQDLTVGRLQLVDDGNGKLNKIIYREFVDGNGSLQRISTFHSEIGSVDYENGIVNINSFDFITPANSEITFTATPSSDDILTKQNNLLLSSGVIDIELIEHIIEG